MFHFKVECVAHHNFVVSFGSFPPLQELNEKYQKH